MPTPDLSTLRAYLATLSREELIRGHRDAVWEFARAVGLDDCRELHAVAMAWTEELNRRTNPQQEAQP